MSEPHDHETRISALEAQVREIRVVKEDTAAALVLARAADRDVSEVREFRKATTSGLNALRQDHVDLRTEMNNRFKSLETKVDKGFAEIREKFNSVDDGFAEMRGKFNRVDDGFAEMRGKFNRVDDGFAEMRGKFDVVTAGMAQITTSLNVLIARDSDQ